MGVAPGTTKVRTCITSSIPVRLGQVRCPLISTQRVDVDEVVACKNRRPLVEVMEV